MSETETASQSATPELIPQPGGRGALLSGGMPGNAGGGRPPGAFTNALKLLRDNPKLHQALERAATDETSKGFGSALKVLTDYDDEKPAEKKQIVGPIVIQVQIVREGRKITSG